MNRLRSALLLGALLGGLHAPARAQLPGGLSLSLEVTPSAALPLGEFAGSNPGPGATFGYGIGGGATLGVGGVVSAYGSYQVSLFSCDQCGGAGLDDQVEDRGWEAGLQLSVPLRLMGVQPWVRGGVIGHQLRFTGNGGSIASEPALGFSVGAGTYLPLLGALQLAPAVRFRSYTADFGFEALPDRTTQVAHVGLDLGLAYRF